MFFFVLITHSHFWVWHKTTTIITHFQMDDLLREINQCKITVNWLAHLCVLNQITTHLLVFGPSGHQWWCKRKRSMWQDEKCIARKRDSHKILPIKKRFLTMHRAELIALKGKSQLYPQQLILKLKLQAFRSYLFMYN